MFSQWIVILHGLRYLKWFDAFFNSQGVTWSWRHSKMLFSPKYENFGIIGKIIWFWWTFNKKFRVKYDVTRRYRVSNFVKLNATIVQDCLSNKLISIFLSISPFIYLSHIFETNYSTLVTLVRKKSSGPIRITEKPFKGICHYPMSHNH